MVNHKLQVRGHLENSREQCATPAQLPAIPAIARLPCQGCVVCQPIYLDLQGGWDMSQLLLIEEHELA